MKPVDKFSGSLISENEKIRYTLVQFVLLFYQLLYYSTLHAHECPFSGIVDLSRPTQDPKKKSTPRTYQPRAMIHPNGPVVSEEREKLAAYKVHVRLIPFF
jgi:hypothetical protein